MSKHGTFDPNKNKSGKFSSAVRFNLKEGSNVFRVLPPFGSLSETGEIAKYWSIYWLTDSNGKKRPVPSTLRKSKEGKILTPDPIADKLNAMEAMVEQAAKNGENPAVIEQMKAKLGEYRPDKGYHLNVLNPAGEIGTLKIRYTAYQAFLEKLKKLSQDGIDAINAGEGNGVFFDFRRVKDEKGRISYAVDVATRTHRDPLSNKVSVEYIESPIDEVILKRMDSEARDLSTLFTYKSSEEMASLATLDPSIISRVFARPETVEHLETEGEDEESAATTMPAVLNSNKTSSFVPPTSPGIATQVAQQAAAANKPAVSVLDNADVRNFLFAGNNK